MRKILATVALLVVTLCAPVLAVETVTHAGAQVEITVPDKWTQEPDGDILVIKSADGGMSVFFMVVENKDADKAFEALDKALEAKMGAITWANDGKPAEGHINEMTTWEYNGKAKEGKIDVDCLSIDTPADKTLCVYWFTDAANAKKYEADVKTIVDGLKPMKAGFGSGSGSAAPAGSGSEAAAGSGSEAAAGSEEAGSAE